MDSGNMTDEMLRDPRTWESHPLYRPNESVVTDAEVLRLYRRIDRLTDALKRVAKWEIPEVARGDNHSRRYIQNVAQRALDGEEL